MTQIIASTYEVIEKIGSGGGGVIYLAKHLRLGKKVVLKADKRKVTAKPDLLRREVDVLKELSHPHIPQVYDFFIKDGTVYTAIEYIEGESLDRSLKKGERFSQPQVIKWAKQLLDALRYLHSPIHGNPPHGYVHSDIKPANIMRTPNQDVYLIDFNIALSLGEENAVGCSPGYASPEHYGLDFSSLGDTTAPMDQNETVKLVDQTITLSMSNERFSSSIRKKVPDVRSDIYSLGATLYHLLSGEKPEKNALKVEPLSEQKFSPQIVRIISKAMNPNPDLRYQSADEMLYALSHLHENDIRTKRLRRNKHICGIALGVMFLTGVITAFVGLKRMQVVENWLKLSEYSKNALVEGDSVSALKYALQALPKKKNILMPDYIPRAQEALSEALGVYDLSDGFKKDKVVTLPSNPLFLKISPNGRTAACMYSGTIAVIDTETADILTALPADHSALSEVEYLTEDIIIYAGKNGIAAYNIMKEKQVWSGKPATAIAVSEDGTTVAAVYKDEMTATIYNADNGEIKSEVNFQGKRQSVTVNDSFANPKDNIFEINNNGTLLGASFDDGSLEIYDLTRSGNDMELFDSTSGYTHFEGGFQNQYFAFAATGEEGSVFAVIDTQKKVQTGGFESESSFGVTADKNGIYVQTENLLVKIHPVTGEQTPLVTTPENLFRFAVSDTYTLATTKEKLMFFDSASNLITTFEEKETGDFVQLSNGVAVVGSMDSPKIKIMKCKEHTQSDVFTYDPSYQHDEARISEDGERVMLFSYKQFRVYDINGKLIKETNIPDAEQVYDQQFIRKDGKSELEVTYNDGRLLTYDVRDGTLIQEEQIKKPDLSLYEEFYTDQFRIESSLHSAPEVFDKKTDKKICELNEDGYLTHITQAGKYIIAQYITTDDQYYGVLMNKNWEVLARLPYLSDVISEELYFDYPSGNVRKCQIYSVEEQIKMAQKVLVGGE